MHSAWHHSRSYTFVPLLWQVPLCIHSANSIQVTRITFSSLANISREAIRSDLVMFAMKQKIFCEGSLLDAVQRSNLFADSKHFVDMSLKHDAETILIRWEALRSAGPVSVDCLRAFLEEYFDEPENELVECEPIDWNPKGEAFDSIQDPRYRNFAAELHKKWPSLHRKISEKVRINPERYSILPVPNPFVVPGGRFREIYYWDTFFIIKGLIASQMLKTVRGMIENMQFLIEEYGFVPNGNRIYYLNRSQPPLLTWCVYAYYQITKDVDFTAQLLPTLRKELAFFQTNRSIMLDGWPSPLYRYCVVTDTPRPESYREDIKSAEHLHNEQDKQLLWSNIAAAAESGRDFSSRWFWQDGPLAGKIEGTRTSQLVPVDLNAIICGNLRMMGHLYDAVADIDESKWCAQAYDEMKQTIYQVLWNEDLGCWFDFDLTTNRQLELFFDTNFFPLFTKCTHEGFDSLSITEYLKKSGVLSFPGGLPSSLVFTGQQWDFPNAWAPTMWILIEGLRSFGQNEIALSLADKWVKKNYNMWKFTGGKMFEKYNVESSCYKTYGGGGEYEVQEGFGWTNGVLLDLLVTYKEQLAWAQEDECDCCKTKQCVIQIA